MGDTIILISVYFNAQLLYYIINTKMYKMLLHNTHDKISTFFV